MASGLGVIVLSKRISTASGICGVGVMVGVFDTRGVLVIVGLRVIVGETVMEGMVVMVGVGVPVLQSVGKTVDQRLSPAVQQCSQRFRRILPIQAAANRASWSRAAYGRTEVSLALRIDRIPMTTHEHHAISSDHQGGLDGCADIQRHCFVKRS